MKSRVEIEQRISRLREMKRLWALDGSMNLPVAISVELSALEWVLDNEL